MKFPLYCIKYLIMNKLNIVLLFVALTYFGCTEKKVGNNELSESEAGNGWKLLFDGKSTKGWHLYNKADAPSA